jgi:hypothetical protein
LRRTTTAWIAGTLGAGLTASIVLAQQLPSSGAGASNASSADTAPLYGAASTRGARYLMRNGLDYLNYQQYDRALRFLREAETHEKELTAPEKLALKQGIERAQNGMREAADTESPYALSERSRSGKGFTVARPETATAGSPALPARTEGRGRRGRPVFPGRDEGSGEPIRLTSAEAAAATPPARQARSIPVENGATALGPQTAAPEIPTLTAPELPTLTAVPSLPGPADPGPGASPPSNPDLTAAPASLGQLVAPSATSPDPGSSRRDPRDSMPRRDDAAQVAAELPSDPAPQAGHINPSGSGQPLPPGPALTEATTVPADGMPAPTQAPELSSLTPPTTRQTAETPAAPAADAGPGALLASETTPPAEAPSPTPREAAPLPVQQPPPPILLETPSATDQPPPASGSAPTAVPGPKDTDPATPPSGGLIPAAMQEPASAGSVPASAEPPAASAGTSSRSTDTDAIPLPPLGADAQQVENPAAPPLQVAPQPAAVTEAASATSPSGTAPGAALNPEPVEPQGTDELPPLPPDLGRDAAGTNSSSGPAPAVSSAPTPAPLTTAPAGGSSPAHTETADEPLPPLPVGIEAPAPIGTAAAPAPIGTATAPAPEPSQRVVVDAGSAEQPPAQAQTGTTAAPAADGPLPLAAAAAESAPAAAVLDSGNVPGMNPETDRSSSPAPEAGALPPSAATRMTSPVQADPFLPERSNPVSKLDANLQRRVEQIARNQEKEDALRIHEQNRAQPEMPPRETSSSNLSTQTQLDISRAPSPAEARPIKAIPVPEDWVPLAARQWSPQSKYWAAAATCHLPLYFQDPMLERYGHSVEQFVGPVGRYLTYPVDDPKQSTQRNQLIQPWFSAGLFALQIIAWPYNGIMDPPWEAQYDLGYYRPGDMIPVDTYWLPLHGYGPPLRGDRY